jgi:hypothetical protein
VRQVVGSPELTGINAEGVRKFQPRVARPARYPGFRRKLHHNPKEGVVEIVMPTTMRIDYDERYVGIDSRTLSEFG